MYSEENEKIAQIIKWIRQDNTNRLIWDILCGDNWLDLAVGEYIEILEKTAEARMYECVLILITKFNECKYMDEVITNVMVNRLNGSSSDVGIITECIKGFKDIATQKGIMEDPIKEYATL